MASFSYLKNNFTGGRVSPLLEQRPEFNRHKNGVRTLQNMTILPQGGITSRPGSIFVSQVKDSSAKVRLVPFEFSTTQSYCLEFGNQYIRVYKDSGQVLESDITITGISQANPGIVTASSHGLSNGDQVYITEVVGMTEVNSTTMYYTVASSTTNSFALQDDQGNDVDTTGYTAYSSGGVANKIYTITTPYLTADLFDLQFTQSADVLSIVHEDYAPRTLTRTSDTSWTLTPLMKDSSSTGATLVIEDGPYLPENTTTTTLNLSGTTGSVTVTASTTTGINSDQGFLTTDVGRLIRWHDGSGFHYLEITARTNATTVTATIKDGPAAAGGATTRWRLGAWSETTGFPKAVTYHQQRRIYAGTNDNPDVIYGSAIDDYDNFAPGTSDSDAYQYTIASGKVNAIYWLESSSRLRVGTEGGVWTLWGGSDNASITPTNVEADQENNIRCKRVQPVNLGNTTLFVQRNGKIIRELAYNFEVDSLVAPDVTIISDDVLGDPGDESDAGAIQMAYQLEPVPTVWVAKDNGELAGLTYLREQEIIGWHNHVFGGTGVAVESVTTVPVSGQDRVWISVKRTINGTTKRYIEKLDKVFRGKTVKDALFVDSAITTDGEEFTTTITPGATSGTGVTFTAGSSVFSSGDVGRVIEGNSGRALIKTYTNGTTVTADILTNFASTSAIAAGSWTLSQNVITGLDHLEGESVSILADGGTHPNRTVSGGSITLDAQYSQLKVGLGYTQKVELLDIDLGSASGTAYGAVCKVNEIIISFFETVGGKIGYEDSKLTDILFREGDDLMNQGIPLFTGIKRTRPKGGRRDGIRTTYQQDDPLPVTIRSMVIRGQVSNDAG